MKSGNYLTGCFQTLSIIFLLSASPTFAQKASYAPFSVNEEAVTATLKIKDATLEDRFAEVFKKHRLNVSSPADWYELMNEIAGMKETDLYIGKEISIEQTEDGVEISGINLDNLEQMVKSIRLVISTPQKADTFLADHETRIKKK